MATNNVIYDSYSNPYDKILLNWEPYINLRDLHLSFADNMKRILDLGTGTGNQVMGLAKKDNQVYAIDINKSMLRYLIEKIDRTCHNIHILLMSAQELGFISSSFDAVTSMNVIYNVPEPMTALNEIYRVLKHEGTFSMSGPLPNADNDQIAENIIKSMKNKGLYDDNVQASVDIMKKANKHLVSNASLFTTDDLEKILVKEIGFREIIHSTEEPYLGNAYFVAARK